MPVCSAKQAAKERGDAVYLSPVECKRGHTGLRSTKSGDCMECRKEWYSRNKERVRANKKRRRKISPNADREYSLKKNYGIGLKEYNLMLDAQQYRCAICGIHADVSVGNRLRVDHCHNTLAVRGLLCNRCNCALGLIDDNIDTLKNAIAYLTRANTHG